MKRERRTLYSVLPEDLNEGSALLRPRRHQETVRVAAESAEPAALAAHTALADLPDVDAVGSEHLSRIRTY